ncbi:hypothetical protein HDU96_006316 [Phlyctochytrium bullatum]|nr:hypothetical protein HDU96_006316 [Phlyctochytrium bullatum]
MQHYSYLNKVILMGNVGKDPEFYPFNAPTPEDSQNVRGVWKFSLATSRSVKRNNTWEKETTWHKIKVYSSSDSGLFATGKLVKGANVTVDGRIEYYTDPQTEKTLTTIVAGKLH